MENYTHTCPDCGQQHECSMTLNSHDEYIHWIECNGHQIKVGVTDVHGRMFVLQTSEPSLEVPCAK